LNIQHEKPGPSVGRLKDVFRIQLVLRSLKQVLEDSIVAFAFITD